MSESLTPVTEPWTDAELDLLRPHMNTPFNAYSVNAVAKTTGRSADAIRGKMARLRERAKKQIVQPLRPEIIIRRCLNCDKKFEARGRFQRLCEAHRRD